MARQLEIGIKKRMKNFCRMKKCFIFVAFLSGTKAAFVSVALFFATISAVNAANIGYQTSNGCYALGQAIVPDRTEKGSLSSFSIKNLNFSFMSGTMKSESKSNNSTLTLPSTGTKSVESKFTISKRTGNFLYCVELLNCLSQQVCESITEMYGVSQVDEIYEKKIYQKVAYFEDTLFDFLKHSISENLGWNDNNGKI